MVFQAVELSAEIDRRVLSNDEAARLLGVPEKTLRRWRRGQTQPRRASVRRMAEVFERDAHSFYTRSDAEPESERAA